MCLCSPYGSLPSRWCGTITIAVQTLDIREDIQTRSPALPLFAAVRQRIKSAQSFSYVDTIFRAQRQQSSVGPLGFLDVSSHLNHQPTALGCPNPISIGFKLINFPDNVIKNATCRRQSAIALPTKHFRYGSDVLMDRNGDAFL